jgi:hypothetical protein
MRASTSLISVSSTPYRFAYAGATMLNIAAAVSVRAVPSPGTGNALSPAYPLSFTFSAPTAIATS